MTARLVLCALVVCSVFGADPVPQWFNIEATLPPDIPDAARDSVRKGFFDQQLWPALMKQGADPTQYSTTQNEFFRQTERQDKSDYPKLRVLGAAALRGLAAPGGAVIQALDSPEAASKYLGVLNKMSQSTEQDARKQGINPAIPHLAGSLVGAAPYFAFVLFVIGAVVRGVAGRNGNRAGEEVEKKTMPMPKPPARPSWITKENMKNLFLIGCVFVLYCVLFYALLGKSDRETGVVLAGSIAATGVTVFLYKRVTRKAKLDS